jgi:UDPglucose 6-dehydrogenase
MTKPVIGFAGMTHLGINSAAAAAAHGFPTLGFDCDAASIARLESGKLPIVEPGLESLIAENRGRIRYSADPATLRECNIVYIACDVPTDDEGGSDLSGIHMLTGKVCAPHMARDATLVVLSQVPPGFTRALDWPEAQRIYQVETLIFGRAVERAMHPERFIVGCADPSVPLPAAYGEFLSTFGCPVLPMRYESAELAKIAINCCLVSSVTVANTLAELSERIGADWHEIVPALKLDRRIGQHAYLAPGLGLTGGNLERDLATVLHLAAETGSEAGLIRSFVANSRRRKDWVLRTLHREVFARNPDATIAVLGLAYKENTHSTKNSPSVALIQHLAPWRVRVHDPVVSAQAVKHPRMTGCGSALDAASQADALVVMTPWPAFRELKPAELLRAMKGRTVIDPYRILNGSALSAAGFNYVTLGRAAEHEIDD